MVRSAANIRNGPSSKSTLIGTAPAGAELEVAEREGGWVRFVDPVTSNTGWIYEGLLDRDWSAVGLPAVKQSNAASVSTAAKLRFRHAMQPDLSTQQPDPRPKLGTHCDPTCVRWCSNKGPAADRYALGYAPNPSAEEFGANKRRFGFFARRRMVREGLLGPD